MLEINQACALNGGCFPGDSAGFPVTIDGSAGRSYRLTSDLDLFAVPDTTAVDLDAPYITLDLNGFEIAGPITCSGSGASLDCGASGNGDGISLNSNADYVSISNGTIRNMSRHGIGASGDRLTVKNVRARNNARDGLNGGFDSIAVNCIAAENGNDGYQFGSGSVIKQSTAFGNFADGIRIDGSNGVIDDSTARNNGGQGFEMGHSSRFGKNSSTGNFAVDSCGGGICSERKRYYATQGTFNGSQALPACASGFHMASLWEIRDPSNLAYDTVLGQTNADNGTGPSCYGSLLPWVRTGNVASTIETGWPGGGNCANWTTTNPLFFGSAAGPWCAWDFDHIEANGEGTELFERWEVDSYSCDSERSVWCIED